MWCVEYGDRLLQDPLQHVPLVKNGAPTHPNLTHEKINSISPSHPSFLMAPTANESNAHNLRIQAYLYKRSGRNIPEIFSKLDGYLMNIWSSTYQIFLQIYVISFIALY